MLPTCPAIRHHLSSFFPRLALPFLPCSTKWSRCSWLSLPSSSLPHLPTELLPPQTRPALLPQPTASTKPSRTSSRRLSLPLHSTDAIDAPSCSRLLLAGRPGSPAQSRHGHRRLPSARWSASARRIRHLPARAPSSVAGSARAGPPPHRPATSSCAASSRRRHPMAPPPKDSARLLPPPPSPDRPPSTWPPPPPAPHPAASPPSPRRPAAALHPARAAFIESPPPVHGAAAPDPQPSASIHLLPAGSASTAAGSTFSCAPPPWPRLRSPDLHRRRPLVPPATRSAPPTRLSACALPDPASCSTAVAPVTSPTTSSPPWSSERRHTLSTPVFPALSVARLPRPQLRRAHLSTPWPPHAVATLIVTAPGVPPQPWSSSQHRHGRRRPSDRRRQAIAELPLVPPPCPLCVCVYASKNILFPYRWDSPRPPLSAVSSSSSSPSPPGLLCAWQCHSPPSVSPGALCVCVSTIVFVYESDPLQQVNYL